MLIEVQECILTDQVSLVTVIKTLTSVNIKKRSYLALFTAVNTYVQKSHETKKQKFQKGMFAYFICCYIHPCNERQFSSPNGKDNFF